MKRYNTLLIRGCTLSLALAMSLLLLIKSTVAQENTVQICIVSGKKSSLKKISKRDLILVYLGKRKSVDGVEIRPLNLGRDSTVRHAFDQRILEKSPRDIASYWQAQALSGKGRPPRAVPSEKMLKKILNQIPNSIGYIDSANVDDSVSILEKF